MAEVNHASALFNAHLDDPEFGSRLLAADARAVGEAMSERTAWKICRDNQWWSVFGKKRHWTGESELHLCAIKDVCSRRLEGYSIVSTMGARLTLDALDSAVSRRGSIPGCIVHSGCGSQFRADSFVEALEEHHLIGSRGRVGAARDTAAIESFFSLLQKKVLDRNHWRTREELRIAIITWIERTYHRRRRKAGLGRLIPIEYEGILAPAVDLAA